MTGTVEEAIIALADTLGAALVASGLVTVPERLQIDPLSDYEPDGDEDALVTAAALKRVETRVVRTLLGGRAARYVVEQTVGLDLMLAGPGAAPTHPLLVGALTAAILAAQADPTLGGVVERVELGDRLDEDLPPNGVHVSLLITLRVRSGDPFGLTP